MNHKTLIIIFIGIAISISGCSSIPQESVTLSEKMGQQIEAIKKSHLLYINRDYDNLESRANKIVDEIFAPHFFSEMLKSTTGKTVMNSLQKASTGTNDDNELAYQLSLRFLKAVNNRIETERQAVLAPIKTARSNSLANADEAYQQVIKGSATLTAFLASVVKVRSEQDQFFNWAGAPAFQDKVANSVSTLSNQIDEINTNLKDKGDQFQPAKDKLNSILSSLKK
jgi:phage gpG-like protein